jgi:hypothetical protein
MAQFIVRHLEETVKSALKTPGGATAGRWTCATP